MAIPLTAAASQKITAASQTTEDGCLGKFIINAITMVKMLGEDPCRSLPDPERTEKNALTGSHETGGGLTQQGREYVRQAQQLGMIIDVSHISDEAFWDIMDITDKPVVASHSNSRGVCNVSRNLTDDMFRAICQSGGVAGFNQYPEFIGMDATLDTACDHILHFLELDPEGRHIALGGDLDGCECLCNGFEGIQSYPIFAQRLLQRGVGEEIVERIFWKNALGVMEQCCM